MKTFKIAYVITNNGDGSASVHFCKNYAEAEIYDRFLQETRDGWGEGEAFEETITFDDDGNLVVESIRSELEEYMDEILDEEGDWITHDVKATKEALDELDKLENKENEES